jgi:N6-L-threonylcarbamoyladenine synthase
MTITGERPFRVLGIESSCDETAAAIVDDGRIVRSDIVASQHEVHARYGGVVPELASRAHILNVVPVVQAALDRAGSTLDEIDGIAVTNAPGLVGALLVGLQTAKAIAWVTGKPLVGVHHLEGHLSAIYLEPAPPPVPHLALIVSGGHTSLVRVDGHGDLEELGATRDDAAGEAFDKGAKLLGLGYPGGAVIDKLAQSGDPQAVAFPRSMTAGEHGADFSFSGLKTALLHHVRAHGVPDDQALADLCASYQAAIVEVLVRKTRRTARRLQLHHVQICGGVAANSGLRRAMEAAGAEDDFRVYVPPIARCTDNAAMIAAAGYHRLVRGYRDGLDLDAVPSLPLARSHA